jgi:hypothetical protein
MLLGAGAALLALADTASGGAPPTGETIWTKQPSDFEIWSQYPQGAWRKRLTGHTRMRCRLNSDGEPVRCKVDVESPAGAGFAQAALDLAKFYRLETGGDWSAWKNRIVTVSIDFTPQDHVRVWPAGPAGRPSQEPKLARLESGDFRARYPFKSRFTGASGRVVLHCPIGRGGVASGCTAVDEQPKNHGFGLAAEQGAQHIQVAGKTEDGLSTEGMTLEKVVIVCPSSSDLPAWDRGRGGCTARMRVGRANNRFH